MKVPNSKSFAQSAGQISVQTGEGVTVLVLGLLEDVPFVILLGNDTVTFKVIQSLL